jgi:hypothetical protein
MAVNKPVGNNARKGAVMRRGQRIHGRAEAQSQKEVPRDQGRPTGKVKAKAVIILFAITPAVVVGLSAFVIQL